MKWLYNLFFSKNSKSIMTVLTNGEAYQSYIQTNNNLDKNLNNLKSEIRHSIEKSISHNKYISKTFYSKEEYSKSGIKTLKQYYIQQGYNVKIKYNFSEGFSDNFNRCFVISWKHFK